MDRILLQTMSRKSVFPAGRYEDRSVQQIFDLGQYTYLGYSYYYYSKISFTNDVLEELLITGDFVIKKPGNNPDIFSKWKHHFFMNLTDKQRMGRVSRIRSLVKKKAKKIEKCSVEKKFSLCSRNQGHTKYKY